MAQKNIYLGQSKNELMRNIQDNFTELYQGGSGGGGITEIADQYVRIWDLDEGMYQLTYAGTKYIYYNGSAGTTTVTISNSTGKCLLFVTSYSTTSKGWECHYNNTTINYIVFGRTSSSSGSYASKNLNYIPTENVEPPVYSSSQYAVGYYYGGTSGISSLNVSTYLRDGEYGLCIKSTTTGIPYDLTENKWVHLKTYSSYYTNNARYAPTIKQDLFVTEDNRTFTRFITYASSTSITYGDWIETTPGDIELPIASASQLGGIKVGSGLSINASGVLSASFKANVLYPNKVISAGTTDATTFVAYSEYYWMILPKMNPTATITFTYGGSTLEKTASVGKPLMIHAYTGATGGMFQLAGLGEDTPSYVYGYSTLSATPGNDIAVYYISPAV